MRVGCVLTLVFFGALTFLYHEWLATVFDPPGNWIGAVVLAILVGLCFGALTSAKAAAGDWNLVRRAQAGTSTLTDGRIGAVIGKVQPLNQTLHTPFLRNECIAYEYEIYRTVRSRDSRGHTSTSKQLQFSGLALTPCVIESSERNVCLLGFPELTTLPEERPTSLQAYRHARQYVRQTEFNSISGLVTGFRELQDYLTDDDGEVFKNWRHTAPAGVPESPSRVDVQDETGDASDDPEELTDSEPRLSAADDGSDSLRGSVLMERSVGPSCQVVAIGMYCEEREGLVPSIGRHGAVNRLFRGEPAEVQKSFRDSAWRNLAGAVIGLAAVHLAVLFLMHQYQHNPKNLEARARQFAEAAREGNLVRLEELLSRGVTVDSLDASGHTALMTINVPEVADFLINHGADLNARSESGQTALMEAARMGRADIVRKLVASGADLDLRSTRYNTTALMQADSSEQFDVAAILEQAGAFDDVLTAENGEPLPADGGEPLATCRAYLQAIYAEDQAALRRLASREWPATFHDVDWQGWRDVRPREPNAIEGYVRDDAATLTVTGVTAKSFRANWVYQLIREEDEWKILRERWVTKSPPGEH